jgi:type IV secretion system protein TrbB
LAAYSATTAALHEYFDQRRILSGQDDPLNRLRRRGNFLELVQGRSHAEIIRLAVREKKNILVVGSTGSGKTTLVYTRPGYVSSYTAY